MFFYDLDNFDGFIKHSLIDRIQEEKTHLSKFFSLYENKKRNLLSIIHHATDVSNYLSNNASLSFEEISCFITSCLEKVNCIIDYIQRLQNKLEDISCLCQENIEENHNEIKATLIEFNRQDDQLSNKILDFENQLTSSANSVICLTLSSMGISLECEEEEALSTQMRKNEKDNLVLLVSEKDQKAYLPYQYEVAKKIYEENSQIYSSIQDVIEKNYIIPLDRFRHSSISRFKESFDLIRKKEKGSFFKALDLALELIFKYDLNPIIIAACRTLDELDIYLDCLEKNEVSKFDCFNIKFEIAPILIHSHLKGACT